MNWHVISNSEGTILAVFGLALLSEAQAFAARIEKQTGLPTYLHNIVSTNRPKTGGSVSMKNCNVRRD